MRASRAAFWVIPILVFSMVIPAIGQAPPGPDDQAPPSDASQAPNQVSGQLQNGPAVARVSFMRGDVTMQRGDWGTSPL